MPDDYSDIAKAFNRSPDAPSSGGALFGHALGTLLSRGQRQKRMQEMQEFLDSVKNASNREEAMDIVIRSAMKEGKPNTDLYEDVSDFVTAFSFIDKFHPEPGEQKFVTLDVFDTKGQKGKVRVPENASITTPEDLAKFTGRTDLRLVNPDLVDLVNPETGASTRTPRSDIEGKETFGFVTGEDFQRQLQLRQHARDERRLSMESRRFGIWLDDQINGRGTTDSEWEALAKGTLDARGLAQTPQNIRKAKYIEQELKNAHNTLFTIASGKIENGLFSFQDEGLETAYLDSMAAVEEALWSGTYQTGTKAAIDYWRQFKPAERKLSPTPIPEEKSLKEEIMGAFESVRDRFSGEEKKPPAPKSKKKPELGNAKGIKSVDFGELKPIDHTKPAIKNPDGTFSTERTITVEADGNHYIIPTIVDGKKYSDKEAIALWKNKRNDAVAVFPDEKQANEYAAARSRRAYIVRGEAKGLIDKKGRHYDWDTLRQSLKSRNRPHSNEDIAKFAQSLDLDVDERK